MATSWGELDSVAMEMTAVSSRDASTSSSKICRLKESMSGREVHALEVGVKAT